MALTFRKAALATALACMGSIAQAVAVADAVVEPDTVVLTFDDLPGALAFFAADYMGLTFGTNNAFNNAWFYTRFGNEGYMPHSGSYFVATDYRLYTPGALMEDAQSIKSAADIIFDGAWFGGTSPIAYKLFNDGVLVYTSPASPVLEAIPQFVASGYGGLVDEIVIVGRQGWFAMDDLTYRPGPIPEPSTYLLFAAGLAGVAWRLRRAAA